MRVEELRQQRCVGPAGVDVKGFHDATSSDLPVRRQRLGWLLLSQVVVCWTLSMCHRNMAVSFLDCQFIGETAGCSQDSLLCLGLLWIPEEWLSLL